MQVYETEDDPPELRVEIKDFKDLVTTTMTCGVQLSNPEINLDTAFWLIPITRVPPINITKKKNPIPFLPDKPGAFISVRYNDQLRGLRRSLSTKSFSHSVTIDLCTKVKALNVKLAPQTMHFCGATSKAVALEGAQIILDELIRAQTHLEYIKANRRLSHIIGEYVKKLVKGERVMRVVKPRGSETADSNESKVNEVPSASSISTGDEIKSIINNNKPKPVIVLRDQDHIIKPISSISLFEFHKSFLNFYKEYHSGLIKILILRDAEGKIISSRDTVPSPQERFDESIKTFIKIGFSNDIIINILLEYISPLEAEYQLANYLLKFADEFDYYSDYTKKILWIFRVCDYFDDTPDNRMCCNKEVAVSKFHEYMTNYNFSFNFMVNRYNLAKLVNHRDGFFTRYDNSIHHSVTIELPVNANSIVPVRNGKKKQKNDVPCWGWLIYKSGNVTMSSPTSNGAEEAYTRLMSIIAENIEDIRASEI